MQHDLDAAMAADADTDLRKTDRLGFLRKKVQEKLNLDFEIADIEERLKEKKEERRKMEYETLPELFMEADVTNIGLPAVGNHPAVDFELKPHYHANISSEWEEDRRQESFTQLRSLKWGDLIKNKYEVQLGLGEGALAKKVEAALRKCKVAFSKKQAVPWASLTAAVKQHYEGGKTLDDTQKRLLGATAGFIVKMKAEPKKRVLNR